MIDGWQKKKMSYAAGGYWLKKHQVQHDQNTDCFCHSAVKINVKKELKNIKKTILFWRYYFVNKNEKKNNWYNWIIYFIYVYIYI